MSNIIIPKIIHQTWKDHNLPEKQKVWSTQIQKMHPTFTYILWTDEDLDHFVKQHFPHYYDAWNNMIIIRKVDIWRYMVLYIQGGIYADLDIECIKSFDNLIQAYSEYSILLPYPIDPCFMISAPGQDFWLSILEKWHERQLWLQNMTKIQFIQNHLQYSAIITFYHTGPLMLENIYNDKFKKNNTICILKQNEVVVNSNDKAIYVKHHSQSSWMPLAFHGRPIAAITISIILFVLFLCIFIVLVFHSNPYLVALLGLILLLVIFIICYISLTADSYPKEKKTHYMIK